jgi:hypothetical protein
VRLLNYFKNNFEIYQNIFILMCPTAFYFKSYFYIVFRIVLYILIHEVCYLFIFLWNTLSKPNSLSFRKFEHWNAGQMRPARHLCRTQVTKPHLRDCSPQFGTFGHPTPGGHINLKPVSLEPVVTGLSSSRKGASGHISELKVYSANAFLWEN